MLKDKNILIVAPHHDDEVLGCGGLLSSKIYRDISILTITFTSEEREIEYKALIDKLGITKNYQLSYEDANLCNKDISDIAFNINKIIKSSNIDTLLIPSPSLHQDHKIVYQSALISSKDISLTVMEYEYPELCINYHNFEPNYFLKLTNVNIEEKIQLFELYKSQVKSGRNREAIKLLSQYRALQIHSNTPVESYKIIKYMEEV